MYELMSEVTTLKAEEELKSALPTTEMVLCEVNKACVCIMKLSWEGRREDKKENETNLSIQEDMRSMWILQLKLHVKLIKLSIMENFFLLGRWGFFGLHQNSL